MMTDTRNMRLAAVLISVLVIASACSGSEDASRNAEATLTESESAVSEESSESRDVGSPSPDGETEAATAAGANPTGDDAVADGSDTSDNSDAGDTTAPQDGDAGTDGSEAQSSGQEVEPAEADDATDGPAASLGETSLDALVDELSVFVEQERGLQFVERPVVRALDSGDFNDAFRALIARDAAANTESFTNFTDIYQAVGIIDDGSDLTEIWTRFGDAGVLGYYDTATGEIVLRGGELTTFTETVLVHELVHALEDQVFGLNEDERFADRTDEIDWTFSALIEGSARVIEARYRATFTQAELDEENAARNSIPRSVSLNEFTPSFLELQFGRYTYGEDFAETLWGLGQSELDAAYEDPPATSESVVNPAAFVAGDDDVLDMALPPADGEIFEQGIWGQAGFAALLTDVFDRPEALEITQGWGNDRFVAWRDGEVSCVRIHVSADSADALDNYADALDDWSQLGDRQIFFPTADLIRITSCG